MNRPRRLATLALVAGLALPVAASAAWNVTGTGGQSATTASIGGGNKPSDSASGTTITASWTRTQLSTGVDASSYVVTDYDAATAGNVRTTTTCPGSGTTTVSCDLTSSAVGDHYLTVTPKYGNWTGTESSRSAKVTVAAALAITSGTKASSNASFSGSGAVASTSITVTVCDQNAFPCASGHVVATATSGQHPSAGSWSSGNTTGALTNGTTYYAQAVQGSNSSNSVTFQFPTSNGSFNVS